MLYFQEINVSSICLRFELRSKKGVYFYMRQHEVSNTSLRKDIVILDMNVMKEKILA